MGGARPSRSRQGLTVARRLDARAPDFAAQFELLISGKRETAEDVAASVRAIIADVRARGDEALIELGRRFDGVELTAPLSLRASARRSQPSTATAVRSPSLSAKCR